MINRGLFVLASSAVVAAGVGVAAPSIAVALKGAGFAGLQGASLVSASLSALGGGAIVIGGKGMVGGLASLVGDGALLGDLTGGSVVSATHLLSKTSPEVIISQGAKLSVVMKEIILKQQDSLNAKAVLKGMKEEILAMNQELKKLQLDRIGIRNKLKP